MVSRLRVICLMVLAFGACSKSKPGDRVIGRVGNYAITEAHFVAAFKQYYVRTGQAIPVNEITRQSVFNSEFDAFVLATHAQESGLASSRESLRQRGIIERQVLTDAFLRWLVPDTMQVDDRVSREMFRRSKTYLRASHIFAETKQKADSLAGLLASGKKTFEQLAAENFSNAYLRENAGDLGLFTLDEMDLNFEEAAFRMKVGEVSKPVKTAYGYSIIKLTGSYPEPIITENQYLLVKPRFEQIAEKRLRRMAEDNYMDSVLNTYAFDTAVLDAAWDQVQLKSKIFRNAGAEFEQLFSPELKKAVIAKSGQRNVSVGDILMEAWFTPDISRQKIYSRTRFEDFVKGLVYRQHMISEARRAKLHKSIRVEKNIEYGFARYLASAVDEEIKKTIFISDEEMLAEYSNNRDIFVRPLELDVSRIVVRSAQKATEALQAVKKGMDFRDAVRKFTMESEMLLSDGRLGYTPVTEFGTFAPKLSSLQPGGVSDVIQYDATTWHIYKVWARKESVPLTFEESKPKIEEKLKLRILRDRRKQLIEETKARNKASVDLKYLNELYINI